MTRINIGIEPSDLCRQHLIAEHREIKRIPNAVKKRIMKGSSFDDTPPTFRLGPGHVKFFYNKLGYLQDRYRALYAECRKRNYDVSNYESAWYGLPNELMNDWMPTDNDIKIIQYRINERLVKMQQGTSL